jgi:predicted Ser/Thr protein kinase
MRFKRIRQIAKGWSSYIWLVSLENGKKAILKEVREKSPRKNLAEREGRFLKLANIVGVGPVMFEANKKENYILMEYIDGICFRDWVLGKKETENKKNSEEKFSKEKISREELYFFIKELYTQLLSLDSINISHNQLQVGKNILVKTKFTNGKKIFVPIIIDFEKASEKTKTKNIGQIESFLFYNPNGAVAKKVRKILNLKN